MGNLGACSASGPFCLAHFEGAFRKHQTTASQVREARNQATPAERQQRKQPNLPREGLKLSSQDAAASSPIWNAAKRVFFMAALPLTT